MAKTPGGRERNQTKLAFDEIKEEKLEDEKGNRNDAICNICFIRTLSSVGANIGLYLCYICNTYLCQDCFKGHEEHGLIKKSERDGEIERYLDEMKNESKTKRNEMFFREEVSLVDRFNIKHKLDQNENCKISGLCGLDDTRLVVCDSFNYCIKVFSIGSHILQRYLRFGSDPLGVTEVKVSSVKLETTEQVVMTTSDISVTNQTELGKQSRLAVTLPSKRRILIINLKQNPAVVTKSITTDHCCLSIDFSEDKIFTFYNEHEEKPGYSRWFISVLSTDGVVIKNIKTDLLTQPNPCLAVCTDIFYVTDANNKVICMNDKGKVISHKTIEWSWPRGISVDTDTKTVYICAPSHHKIYRLDSRLESIESLFDLKSVDLDWPTSLCLYKNRLYVGHGLETTNKHFVNVVRVL